MTQTDSRPKAGIITFHKSLSYGGCLQAYACMVLLRNAGYDPFFVDYENEYEARKKSDAVFRHGTAKEKLAAIVKKLAFRQDDYQRRAFSSFYRSLPLSPSSYSSLDEMKDIEADVLVVGSDQVWSPLITNGVDPAFFLHFGKARRRVSLSSSMGSYTMGDSELMECAGYLNDFSAISVREEFARAQIEPEVDQDVYVSLDPTLQLGANLWREYSAMPDTPLADEPYVLVFMVSSSPTRYEAILKEVREKTGYNTLMVRLNSKRPTMVDEVIPATPAELVWLIDHAALVITDSFHGLAFSINMETPFFLLPNRKNNVRLAELISSMKLDSRMIDETLPFAFDANAPSFVKAREVLARRRAEDSRWLVGALGEEVA